MADWNMEFAERDRGVLSPKERKHLMGLLDEDPEEYEHAIRQREYRIRQHVRECIVDFLLLAQRYDTIEQVFRPLRDDYEEQQDRPLLTTFFSPDDAEFSDGLSSLFSVLFRGLAEVSEDGKQVDHRLFQVHLNRGVRRALEQMYVDQGYSVIPNHILYCPEESEEAKRVVPIQKVKDAYDRDAPLHSREMKHLYGAGLISFSTYDSYDPVDAHADEDEVEMDALEQMHQEVGQINQEIEARRERDSIVGEGGPTTEDE